MRWLLALAVLLAPATTEAQGKLPPVVIPAGWAKVDWALPDMSEYGQPAIYESWWLEIGACEHVIVPLELTRRVHFVYVNSPTMIVDLQGGIYGYASAPSFTVFLALPELYHKSVVMHEMLHMLDYWNGIDEGKTYHRTDRFETCGIHQYYRAD